MSKHDASDTSAGRSTSCAAYVRAFAGAHSSAAPPSWTPSQFGGAQNQPGDPRKPGKSNKPNNSNGSNKPGRKHRVREYTLGEEVANSVTHGIGAALAVAALVLLIVKAAGTGSGVSLFAALVFGITLLVEYLMSTMYHALAHEGAKRVFKVLDHCCIYLLIAGTYTPYCLITLAHANGVWLAAFVWAVALIGVACEAFWTFRPRWISAVIYLLLGWCVVAFVPPLYEALPAPGFWLLAAGGVSYTVGAVFYVLKNIPYMHSVFHVFVLVGSVLQFISVLLFVI